MADDFNRVWVGNLPEQIDDELLYELFLQAGPVADVVLPKHPGGRPKTFAFITFKYQCSAMYSKELFKGTTLFGKELIIQPKMRDMSEKCSEGLVSLNSVREFNGSMEMRQKTRDMPEKNDKNLVSLNSLRGLGGGAAMKGRHDLSSPGKKGMDLPYMANNGGNFLPPGMSGSVQKHIGLSNLSDFDMLLQMGQQLQSSFGGSPVMNFGFSSPGVYPSQALDPVMNKRRENSNSKNEYHSHGRNHDYDRNRHEKNHPYRDDRRDDRRYGYSSSRNRPSSSHHRNRK